MKILPFILIFFTVSCASTSSSSWDCPRQKGVGCVNINGADNNYNSNTNSNYDNNKECDKACRKRKRQFLKNLKSKKSLSKNKETPSLRSSEKISRVLFSSYIDEQGNRHEESLVYYVDESTDWIK